MESPNFKGYKTYTQMASCRPVPPENIDSLSGLTASEKAARRNRPGLLSRLMGRVSPPRLPDFSSDEVFRFLQRDKAAQERLHIPMPDLTGQAGPRTATKEHERDNRAKT